MGKRKLLHVTSYFPPMGGAGVQRHFYFAKYLPSFGWQPFVITVKNVAFTMYDPTVLQDIPEECQIYRTNSLQLAHLLWWQQRLLRGRSDKSHDKSTSEFSKPTVTNLARSIREWFFIPDDVIMWAPFAVQTAVKICRSGKMDAVLCTSPPYGTMVVGFLVSKATNLPLIVDLRDPWTQDPYFKMPTWFHRNANEALERKVLNHASMIIAICSKMKENILNKHSNLQESRIRVITNGFASEDFEDIQPIDTHGKFTISYVGALYEHHRDVFESFCKALVKAIDQEPELGENVQIMIVGRTELQVSEIAKKYGLEDKISLTGYLSHRECLQYTMGTDLLLLLIKEIAINKTQTVTIPGKLFEYLASGNPIMMIGPQGDAADIVTSSKIGTVSAPNDVNAISSELIRYFQQFENGHLRRQLLPEIMQYERKGLTEKLAGELDDLLLRKNRRIGG